VKKKLLFCLMLVVIVTGGVFAQERAPNTFLGGINVGFLTFGLDIEYERAFPGLLPGLFAVAVETGYTTIIIFPIYNIDVRARWYPWAETFFADVGVGYGSFLGVATAFQISPGVGWRIDVGEPNGLVVVPSLQLDYFVASSVSDFSGNLLKICIRFGYSF